MEHEVYVPFSVGSVRAALAEQERVARCVPGLQLDAAGDHGDALEGRLRVRIGGSTITYRGTLTLIPQGDGFTVEGSGTEARGSGAVKLSLKIVPRLVDDGEGTRLVCSGTVTGEGRIATYEDKVATGAGRRLLERFCTALTESMQAEAPAAPDPDPALGADPAPGGPETRIDARRAAGLGEPDDNDRAIPGIPGPEKGEREGRREKAKGDGAERDGKEASESPSGAQADAPSEGPADEPSGPAEGPEPATGTPGVFDAEIPPPSLDPLSDGADDGEPAAADEADGPLTAEAAHARRTMIGRSAEEVDHAPPRGRYTPVPAPEPATATAALRWAAPAAAAVLAGAVVLTRALRRRR